MTITLQLTHPIAWCRCIRQLWLQAQRIQSPGCTATPQGCMSSIHHLPLWEGVSTSTARYIKVQPSANSTSVMSGRCRGGVILPILSLGQSIISFRWMEASFVKPLPSQNVTTRTQPQALIMMPVCAMCLKSVLHPHPHYAQVTLRSEV